MHCGRNVKEESQRERGCGGSEMRWRSALECTLNSCCVCKFLEKVIKVVKSVEIEGLDCEYSLQRRERGITLSSFL